MIYTKKTITVKRRIKETPDIVDFIRHNSNLRRFIWNDFVEAANKVYDQYGIYTMFDIKGWRKSLNAKIVDNLEQRICDGLPTDLYCSDMVLSVYNDGKAAIHTMMSKDRKARRKPSKLHFKKFDPFRRSFNVRCQNQIQKRVSGDGYYRCGRVNFSTTTNILFKASTHHVSNYFEIELMEPISDEYIPSSYEFVTYDKYDKTTERCSFKHDDIKEVVFMEEFGKFYMLLVINVIYTTLENSDYEDRKKLAGIDLGIHNPITLYDGSSIEHFYMPPEIIHEIKYLERRASRIQNQMDLKYSVNKTKYIQKYGCIDGFNHETNNYIKLRLRYRKIWFRIFNIRRNWRYQLASRMSKAYKHVVVDEFSQPDNKKLILSSKLKRHMNSFNRNHAMYLFMMAFKHECGKNACSYIIAPKFTTRTCSKCGFINEKLPLYDRVLSCKQCGADIDRDDNAAINCFKSYRTLDRDI